MQHEALKRGGDGKALYTDCYTGKTLRGGDAYDYEHLRSAEELYNKYKHIITDTEIAEVVNCVGNVGVTLRVINQSKGKRKMEDWIGSALNRAEHKVDIKHSLNSLKEADEDISRILKKYI